MTNEILQKKGKKKKKWNSWSGFWICHCWVFSKNKNKMKTIMIENSLANPVSTFKGRKQILKTISQNAFCWCLERLKWEGEKSLDTEWFTKFLTPSLCFCVVIDVPSREHFQMHVSEQWKSRWKIGCIYLTELRRG